MEEFEPSSEAWNQKWSSSSPVRGLESEMEEFEPSSDVWIREWRSSSQVPTLGIGNAGVRAKFRRLESVMEEVRAKFRRLESGMQEFEPSSDVWNREWRSSSQVPTLGIGNAGVRAKFRRLESVSVALNLSSVSVLNLNSLECTAEPQ